MLEHDTTSTSSRANDRLAACHAKSPLLQRRMSTTRLLFGAIASRVGVNHTVDCDDAPPRGRRKPGSECALIEHDPQILTHDTRPVHGQYSARLWLTGFEKKTLQQARRAAPCEYTAPCLRSRHGTLTCPNCNLPSESFAA